MAHFTTLPDELILQIVYKLPLQDIVNIKHTCRAIFQSIPASVYSLYKLKSRIGSPSESQLRRAEDKNIYNGSIQIWEGGFGDVNHRTKGVGNLACLPGMLRQHDQAIEGVTDGREVLFGTFQQTSKDRSLLIFDTRTTKATTIDPAILHQRGWPSTDVQKAVYHSRHLILLTSDVLYCFHIYPDLSDLQCIKHTKAVPFIRTLNVSKDFICISTCDDYNDAGSLQILSRTTLEILGILDVRGRIRNIAIRNTMIIGLAQGCRLIQCWRYDISKDAASSISYLKSINTGKEGRGADRFRTELSVSYDPEHYVLASYGFFVSKDKYIHEIIRGKNLRVDRNAQFLATLELEGVDQDVALIVIFDVLTMREVNRVKFIIHTDLGLFLGYQLLFGLILGYFTRGIVRIGPAGQKFDLVQEINWENSEDVYIHTMWID